MYLLTLFTFRSDSRTESDDHRATKLRLIAPKHTHELLQSPNVLEYRVTYCYARQRSRTCMQGWASCLSPHLSAIISRATISRPQMAPSPSARPSAAITLRRLPDSSTDQVRLARKASPTISGNRLGSFDPRLGPLSRGAVC